MSRVVCILPKAGLGNQLFPLLNALVFGKLNDLPVTIIGYHHLKIGPYLRKEKIKRRYRGYFRFQKSVFGEAYDSFLCKRAIKNNNCIYEPELICYEKEMIRNKVFVFEKLPTYHDYFIHLKPHRSLVKLLLKETLNSWVYEEIEKLELPVIGMHIRMGDFRKLKQGEDFARVGHVRTPEHYFVAVVNQIRSISGMYLPVSLFTDGYRNEFEEVFSLTPIKMIEGNADIVDLLLLSKSKLIITANGSTFSYWAGFLSDAPIIKHPDHLYADFRPEDVNSKYYEGPLIENKHPDLLEKNLKTVAHQFSLSENSKL
ncbi:MAG: hypothetical protein NTZ41_00960 [Sphingobacteriales bacterium]|nr:hypothetical protein [Sphingobacteriales bacterium]